MLTYCRNLSLALLLLLPAAAGAQTMMSCAQNDNFACLLGAEDITGPWNFLGAAPMSFEGATNDTIEINVAVTDPMTSDKTLTIPDANSATATATGLPCSAGNHISDFNVTTGVFTCSADSGGTADNVQVNGAAATDANFINSAGITWTLNTGPSPDTIAGAIAADAIGAAELSATAISPGDVGAGDLSGVVFFGTCTATPCTLSQTPADEASLIVWQRGIVMRNVTAAPGVNEIDFTAANTIIFAAANAISSGADSAFYFGVR